MNRLSVTLIVRNEERNLPRALGSLAGLADEVLVVDSGSTDRTIDIARQYEARILERTWTDFSDQKNFAAAQARHEWIFNLDADEELSPELQAELRAWKGKLAGAAAYAMPRKARYLGRWVHHSGWYPDPKTRLYRRDRARFVGSLHESLQVDGPVAYFQGELYHHTFPTVTDHVARLNTYSTLAAEALFRSGRRRWLLPLLFSPPWMFLRTLVLKQGFRDGYVGWVIANLSALSAFLKYVKLGVLVELDGRSSREGDP